MGKLKELAVGVVQDDLPVPSVEKQTLAESTREQWKADRIPRKRGKRHYDGKRSDSVGLLFRDYPKESPKRERRSPSKDSHNSEY